MRNKHDIFYRAADLSNPKDRMVEVVRWYLSSVSASKKVIGFSLLIHCMAINSFTCIHEPVSISLSRIHEFEQVAPSKVVTPRLCI